MHLDASRGCCLTASVRMRKLNSVRLFINRVIANSRSRIDCVLMNKPEFDRVFSSMHLYARLVSQFQFCSRTFQWTRARHICTPMPPILSILRSIWIALYILVSLALSLSYLSPNIPRECSQRTCLFKSLRHDLMLVSMLTDRDITAFHSVMPSEKGLCSSVVITCVSSSSSYLSTC